MKAQTTNPSKSTSTQWLTRGVWLALAAATLSLASCGTVHGFGHDVETAGDAIQDAASH